MDRPSWMPKMPRTSEVAPERVIAPKPPKGRGWWAIDDQGMEEVKGGPFTNEQETQKWIEKNSKHGFFYHTAPAEFRQQIEQQGLVPTHDAPVSPWAKARDSWMRTVDQPSGVYLHDDPRNAVGYAYNLQGHKDKMFPGDEEDFREDDWDWSGQPDYDVDPEGNENFEPEYKPQPAYDIWKVNTQGMPMHIDPETALLRGELTAEEAQQNINEDTARGYGSPPNPSEGHHWYTPEAIPPERLQLHQSVYPHEMTENNYYEALENQKEIPEAWKRVPLNEWNEKAQQRYLGDPNVMREIAPQDR